MKKNRWDYNKMAIGVISQFVEQNRNDLLTFKKKTGCFLIMVDSDDSFSFDMVFIAHRINESEYKLIDGHDPESFYMNFHLEFWDKTEVKIKYPVLSFSV
ncbi:hypothetical protein ES702_04421 [subsurface metagenome]